MTRSNSVYMLRRAYERVVASLGALTVTALMLFSVNAQAAAPQFSHTRFGHAQRHHPGAHGDHSRSWTRPRTPACRNESRPQGRERRR